MKQESQSSFSITRTLPAPAETVYRAWTAFDQLRQWWHPNGAALTGMDNELRPGGRIAYHFGGEEGKELFSVEGSYEEVEEGKKLVYTWNWDMHSGIIGKSAFRLSVSFGEEDGQCRLTVVQDATAEHQNIQVLKTAWEGELSRLESFLAQSSSNQQHSAPHTDGNAAGAGYMELPEQQKVGE